MTTDSMAAPVAPMTALKTSINSRKRLSSYLSQGSGTDTENESNSKKSKGRTPHSKYLKELKTTVKVQHEDMKQMLSIIEGLQTQINELKLAKALPSTDTNSINEMKKDIASLKSVNDKPIDYKSLFDSEKKSPDNQLFISSMNKEIKEKSRIENNIVISGIKADDTNSDQNKVTEILNILDIEYKTVKKFRRIYRKKQTTKSGEALKEFELVVVEFNDISNKIKAIDNSKKLKGIKDNVYINADKTEAEREYEMSLRHERNKRNIALPHQSVSNPRHRYGIRKDKSLYYWAISNTGGLREQTYTLPNDASEQSMDTIPNTIETTTTVPNPTIASEQASL